MLRKRVTSVGMNRRIVEVRKKLKWVKVMDMNYRKRNGMVAISEECYEFKIYGCFM